MIELLSPVGKKECLMAAINSGCNAVYLSGINFGARSFAGNFNKEEMLDAIKICHLYGVKVYVTVNTLIYDNEVERFIEYIEFLHKNSVDAVIMQDIGMIDLVRKTYPNLVIHASTQVNIHNLETVKMLECLGVKRVVLARETPIELIEEIKKNTNVEIEVFIHGALCISYSGQCLFSAMIGNRSGNRGTCAQSCRQKYSLEANGKIIEKDKYLLSTKDLNTLEYIDKLIDLGVDSLKIEGRMKSPEYVYLVTNTYRKVIDNYYKNKTINVSKTDIVNIEKIFNRGFTKGFIFNENNKNYTNTFRPNHLGVYIGKVIDYKDNYAILKLNGELNINDGIRIIGTNDVGTIVTKINYVSNNIVKIKIDKVNIGDNVLKTADYNLLKEIDKKINNQRKIYIDAFCEIKIDSPIKFIVKDDKNTIELETDYVVQKAINCETTLDQIKDQLNKLGDSIYLFNELNIQKDDTVFIPKIVLNDLRRKIISLLNEKRLYKIDYIKRNYNIELKNYEIQKNRNILISTFDNYLKYKDDYDTIIVDDIDLYEKIKSEKVILRTDRINEHLRNFDCKLLVNDLGSILKYSSVDTDFSLNITNSYSVALMHSLGVNKVTLSYELSYNQIKTLVEKYKERYKKHPNLEVIVESYPEVMISKCCLLKDGQCGYLIDRFNNKYKLKIKNNFMYIYNYKKFVLNDNFFEIGINNIRINMEVGN